MVRRLLVVSSLWCLAAPPVSAWVEFGDGGYPTKLHQALRTALSGEIRVQAVRWVSIKGRTVTVPLPRPVNLLDDPVFLAPPGEWADLELVLADAPRVALLDGADESTFALSADPWTVTLDRPAQGGDLVGVTLALPADLLERSLDATQLDHALRDAAIGVDRRSR